MEETDLEHEFGALIVTGDAFRDAWHTKWGAQDGRFRCTPAADGTPELGLWRMIYWTATPAAAELAAQALAALDYGFEVRLDAESGQYVLLTDYASGVDW